MMAGGLRRAVVRGVELLPLSVRQSIRKWPVVGVVQRALFRYAIQDCPIEPYRITAGPAKGLRLALRLPQNKSFWLGTFEIPVANQIFSATKQGDVCWDIGAHIGYFSALMSRHTGETVHCFEPLPENRRRLEMQVQLNSNVRFAIYPFALSSRVGRMDLHIMPDDDSLGKLADSTFQANRPAAKIIDVELSTIDRVVAEGTAPPPTFVKIDTEGVEFQILSGGLNTLRRYAPSLLVENHGCPDDPKMFALLHKLGYHCTVVETQAPLSEAGIEAGQHAFCEVRKAV